MEKKNLILDYLSKLIKDINFFNSIMLQGLSEQAKLNVFSGYIARVAIWYANDKDNEFASIFVVMDIIEEEYLKNKWMIKNEIELLRVKLSNL